MATYRPEIEFVVEIDSSMRVHIPAPIKKLMGLKPKQLVHVSISLAQKVENTKPEVEFTDEELKALAKGGLNQAKDRGD